MTAPNMRGPSVYGPDGPGNAWPLFQRIDRGLHLLFKDRFKDLFLGWGGNRTVAVDVNDIFIVMDEVLRE